MRVTPHQSNMQAGLVVVETHQLLEGDPAEAWAWSPPEDGCPMLSPQPEGVGGKPVVMEPDQ